MDTHMSTLVYMFLHGAAPCRQSIAEEFISVGTVWMMRTWFDCVHVVLNILVCAERILIYVVCLK